MALARVAAGGSGTAGDAAASATTTGGCSNTANGSGAAGNTTAITTETIGGRTESNHTIAMHHFAIATAATGTVGVECGVVSHILSLAGFSIYLDIIHLDIAAPGIIVVLDIDIPRRRAGVNIILVAGAQCPASNIYTTHFEVNMFRSGHTASAYGNTARTNTGDGAADTRRIIG